MKKTKYQIIADDIRSAILSKSLQVNTSIPSELQLQKKYQVSRHTVRQAMALLVNEGYLRKERGSGTYVSDVYLKQLKPVNKKTIGVITTYLSDYIFPSIIRGIEKELSRNNYSLLLASTNNDVTQERKSLEQMLARQVDGLIIEPTKSNQYNPNLSYYLALKERRTPFVMLNAYYEELDVPAICLDDVQAGYLAVDYLLSEGHTSIGLITKIDDLQGKNRMRGYIRAFESHHKLFESEKSFTYTTESKMQMLQMVKNSLLDPKQAITALACYNDEIALEMVTLAKELNLKIPDQLSIIGQDDSFLSKASEISLTTITHPKEKMGHDAARWIIEATQEKKELPQQILYTPKLIKRDSTMTLSSN
ncbi:GntR family transcriptional regulator [Melissococcus plutonius]|uniref:Transcriptional repressor of the arabinose operon n=2 Tax=Melissococcus plutonius TaxID=33970 RepID=F3YAX1_MELPT|nr:GntR family transcriptional regulator [Melissococcus plutonius]BAL62000.1 transcriptional repressor of the arabinose operon [Melissococcus plutonius DAT561]AIM25088.1 arabinose metabolism transcriptional repressor [Melissococcus plutonius S1]KMT25329.1 arabinose metabolism transcriptional repressor [Melissococcus plutonius]KMT26234.1 arabinose metabolism transcriptional repressor [Melissococcus plutonius]KMT26964.1 arabinose metabolism transcriptional repressor [Melissococcus plutonius]